MSRIGKQEIKIPGGVTVSVVVGAVSVKGPKGELSRALHPAVSVTVDGDIVRVSVAHPEEKFERALWGTVGAHLHNMIEGAVKGFERKLEVNGVGYRVAMQGSDLKLELGFSHPVIFPIPKGITAAVEKNVITLSGADKELVGDTAARLRALRKPEPYKGKGIKYSDEIIRRKAGKAAAKGSSS